MTPDTDKLVRQLSLVAYLMSERRASSARDVKQAVEGYADMSDEAFARRFYADRAELLALGVPISSNRDEFTGEELYTLPRDEYFLPPLRLSDDELAALSTAVYLLEGQFAYAEPLRLALQNLALGRPNPTDDAEREVTVDLLDPGFTSDVAARLQKIETAVGKQRTIVFPYGAISTGQESRRTLDPYAVYLESGQWYVIGLDRDREAIRTFRLSRIRGDVRFATRRERDFRVPPDFDPAHWRDRAQWQLGEAVDSAVIRVSPQAAWLVERTAGRHGIVVADDDRSITFTTDYADEHMLLRWLIGLDGQALPVAPAELVESMLAGLEQVATAHEGPAPDHAPPSGDEPEPAPAPAARGESPVAPERFAVLQALLAHVLAAVGDEQRAVIAAGPVREQFGFDHEQLREHLNLLNLVNFGGGCYAVYAEFTDDDTIDVEKELYGEEFRRPARLSPLEAKALQMALDLVGPLIAADAHTSLDAVREKVEAAFGRYDMRGSAPAQTATVDNDVLSVLSSAMRDREVVQIAYLSREGASVEERVVEPHRLRGVRGEWYCDTWDRTREGERTFRVDRIRGAVARGEHFDRREGVGRRDDGQLGGQAGSAEVWFSPEVARWEVERRPEVVPLADGAAIATVRYGGRRWLATELCRYLGDAVLLDPQPLREQVTARARELAAAVREAAGIRATR